jgi:pimeloyl-ACP methyl ester carboxylesterase
MRRGFGRSGGAYSEDLPKACDYLPAVRISAEDVMAAVTSLRKESWVDPDHVVLLGHSTGGLAMTAAAAAKPPGVVGILNFDGRRHGRLGPDQFCDPNKLVDTMAALGRPRTFPLFGFTPRMIVATGPISLAACSMQGRKRPSAISECCLPSAPTVTISSSEVRRQLGFLPSSLSSQGWLCRPRLSLRYRHSPSCKLRRPRLPFVGRCSSTTCLIAAKPTHLPLLREVAAAPAAPA